MPSLQVVDLSDRPKPNYVGEFTRQFGETLNQGIERKSNDDIFNRIKQQYPNDTPEQRYQRLSETSGLTPDYQKDKLGFIKDLIGAKSKNEENDIRRRTNEINSTRALNQTNALEQTSKNQPTKTASEIAKYNKGIWKDAEPEDLSLFNRLTGKYMAEDKLPLNEASDRALKGTREIREALNNGFTKKITAWYGTPDNTETEKLVVDQTKAMLQVGLDEKSINKGLKKAGWSGEDIIIILDRAKNQSTEHLDGMLFGG